MDKEKQHRLVHRPVVAYGSPKTKHWIIDKHIKIIECILESLEKIIKAAK